MCTFKSYVSKSLRSGLALLCQVLSEEAHTEIPYIHISHMQMKTHADAW